MPEGQKPVSPILNLPETQQSPCPLTPMTVVHSCLGLPPRRWTIPQSCLLVQQLSLTPRILSPAKWTQLPQLQRSFPSTTTSVRVLVRHQTAGSVNHPFWSQPMSKVLVSLRPLLTPRRNLGPFLRSQGLVFLSIGHTRCHPDLCSGLLISFLGFWSL